MSERLVPSSTVAVRSDDPPEGNLQQMQAYPINWDYFDRLAVIEVFPREGNKCKLCGLQIVNVLSAERSSIPLYPEGKSRSTFVIESVGGSHYRARDFIVRSGLVSGPDLVKIFGQNYPRYFEGIANRFWRYARPRKCGCGGGYPLQDLSKGLRQVDLDGPVYPQSMGIGTQNGSADNQPAVRKPRSKRSVEAKRRRNAKKNFHVIKTSVRPTADKINDYLPEPISCEIVLVFQYIPNRRSVKYRGPVKGRRRDKRRKLRERNLCDDDSSSSVEIIISTPTPAERRGARRTPRPQFTEEGCRIIYSGRHHFYSRAG